MVAGLCLGGGCLAGAAGAAEAPPPAPASTQGPRWDGFAQLQYERREDSRDARGPSGRTLNADGFSLRRARLSVEAARGPFSTLFELDAGTRRSQPVVPRRVQGVFDAGTHLRLTVGLTGLPFGDELPFGAERRLFAERTAASRALFPGETDAGVRLSGAFGPLTYDAAVMAGASAQPPEDGRQILGEDPLAAPDWLGRLGFQGTAGPVQVSAGLSLLSGYGQHAGTPATKAGLVWRDLDEDSTLDAGELTPLPAVAATPSIAFSHWATAADLRVLLTSPVGQTTLFGEAVLASNLDRGALPADPVSTGYDLREFGYGAALTHRCPFGGTLGARLDVYDPDSDLTESRRGDRVPVDASTKTLSAVIGQDFADETWRVTAQFDHIVDHAGRSALGVPTDLSNDRLTLRLQVSP